jgi:hypothetical protein
MLKKLDTKCDPGAISYPGGVIPFDMGKPTLCVNDQIGYIYGDLAVLVELQEGNIDSLIEMAKKKCRSVKTKKASAVTTSRVCGK